MNESIFESKELPRQFLFWSIHVTGCALPSFLIALGFDYSPVPMLIGIATFIAGFTMLTTTTFFHRRRNHLLGRAVRKGARIRLWVSLASLPVVLAAYYGGPDLIHLTPDFWCGFLAWSMIERVQITLWPFPSEFFGTYILTLVEGMVMAATLAVICFLLSVPARLNQLDRAEQAIR